MTLKVFERLAVATFLRGSVAADPARFELAGLWPLPRLGTGGVFGGVFVGVLVGVFTGVFAGAAGCS